MYDIVNFTAADMVSCGEILRKLNVGALSMEEVAVNITQFLYDNFRVKETNETTFALVRLYKTHPYNLLPSELQNFAHKILSQESDFSGNIQCLTLLSSRGDKEAWNSRKTSQGHQTIPLFSENFVHSLPMVSGLIKQLGLEISDVVAPDTSIQIENHSKSYNVFYISDARGSAFIPAQQEFVIPYGIRSVIGFGGIDRKSTRLNSSHIPLSRMPSSA